MNEKQFAKLVNKSKFNFIKMRIRRYSLPIRNEDNSTWLDEFDDIQFHRPISHYIYRTFIYPGKRQREKNVPNKALFHIRYDFELADDSKIKMTIFYREFDGRINVERFISYNTFKNICTNGLYISSNEFYKLIAEQSKIDKEKEIDKRKAELEQDFNHEETKI